MADQFDNNARAHHPDAEIDDPLAELARIIGYERPSEDTAVADRSPESSEFDLEAELMRELDVPQAPSIDELDRIEADEALDAMLSETVYDPVPEHVVEGVNVEDPRDLENENAFDGVPEFDSADFMAVEGRSSDALLKAIENEFPIGRDESPEPEGSFEDGGNWALETGPEELEPVEAEGRDEADASAAADSEPVPGPAAAAAMPFVAGTDEAAADDDDVLADMVRFDLRSKPSFETDSPAVPAAEPAVDPEIDTGDASLDFEEYLSTELDVFQQEVGIDERRHAADQSAQMSAHHGTSDFDVETALDALNDETLDDEVAVFDDAAEELLAAINDDAPYGGRPGSQASPTPVAEADDWSLDSIEQGAADELDDELGDLFALPDRPVEPAAQAADVGDDLEIDLEQVLAESFDGSDDDWAEPLEFDAEEQAQEPVVADIDWLSSSPAPDQPAQRDEMAEAFFGLVPEEQSDAATAVAPSAPEPEQGDWLAGFDTSEQVVQPGRSHSGSSDYYFDAELISESDDPVELVSDIDVPELVHDEPQPFDPDYDTEIEREFADIIDRNEPAAEEQTAAAAAVYGSTGDWSREPATPRGYEISDDYLALERELEAGNGQAGYAAAHAGVDRLDGRDLVEQHAADEERSENGSRGPVLAVAVLGLALLAGVAAFGWSMFSGDETTADGGPRIIRADKDPVKVLPENPGGVTVPNQDKAVYDRVAGGEGATTGQPALVNSAEEPVDVVQRTLDPEILPLEGRSDFASKSEERLSADEGGEESAPNGVTAPVVSPRKVRTMIVKPDGSIVAREVPEPQATAPEASAQQTEVAAASEPAASGEIAQASQSVTQEPSAEAAPAAETAAAEPEQPSGTQVAATEGTVAPVRVVTTQPIRQVANAPVPQGRPADQPVNVVGTVSQGGRVGAAPSAPAAPAAAEPVAVASAPAAAAPAANPGGYYVQIASQPTAEGAQASWRTLSNRYSSVLGGLGVDIQRADIPGKGVFHRVRVPAGTRDQANALCSRYKAAGGSCFVSR